MRNLFIKSRDSDGLTIIELLTAISLVALLFAVIIQGQLFVRRFVTGWENEIGLYEEGNFILKTIAEDIGGCRSIMRLGSDYYRIISAVYDTIDYRIRDSTLFRNSRRLNSAGHYCQSLNLEIVGFVKGNIDSLIIKGGDTNAYEVIYINLGLMYKKQNEIFRSAVRYVRYDIQ